MKTISMIEYTNFVMMYSLSYGDQRFGQAFMNYFYPNMVDQELFYCDDREEAVDIIFKDYIDFGSVS